MTTTDDVLNEATQALSENGVQLDRTLLETWIEMLEPASKPGRPQLIWAAALVRKYPFLPDGHLHRVWGDFHALLREARKIAKLELDSDPAIKTRLNEKDGEENKGHYLNVVGAWQRMLRVRAESWGSGKTTFAEMVAILEAERALIGDTGCAAMLDALPGAEFDAEDMEYLEELASTGGEDE